MRIEGGRPPSPLKLCFIPFFLLGCVNKTVLAHRDVHKPRKAIAAKSIPPGAAFFFYKGLKTAKLCNTKVFLLVTELTAPQIPAFTPGAASNRLASTSQELHRLASVHRAFTSELLYQQVRQLYDFYSNHLLHRQSSSINFSQISFHTTSLCTN